MRFGPLVYFRVCYAFALHGGVGCGVGWGACVRESTGSTASLCLSRSGCVGVFRPDMPFTYFACRYFGRYFLCGFGWVGGWVGADKACFIFVYK